MPVNSNYMGLGSLGLPNAHFKRKYRWTFELQTPAGAVSEQIVKVAARPQLNIEELEINYLHGKMFIPGKATWETLTVTYYDVSTGSNDISTLYAWLRMVHEFFDPNGGSDPKLRQSSVAGNGATPGGTAGGGWAATANLYLYDGVGTVVETWNLGMIFPTSIQWGDLDYGTNDEVNIELTLRYSRVNYKPGSCMTSPKYLDPVGCK